MVVMFRITVLCILLTFIFSLLFNSVLCKNNSGGECPKSCRCLDIYVDCAQSNFVEVPQSLPEWTENLDLNSNRLHDNASIALKLLTNLTNLKLNKNHLTKIPLLDGLRNLSLLSLSHNKITTIDPEAIAVLSSLIRLDLSGNRIEFINPGNFPSENSLSYLNLNNNLIRVLEKGCFDTLVSLIELKLSRNKISHLSKDVFIHQKQLKYLELNRNQLGVVESLSLQYLKQLTVLKLKRNHITQLMDGAFFGVNVSVLELDGNMISKVTKHWLYGLTYLKTLSLTGNTISIIDQDVWSFCKYLKELDLSNNHLLSINKNTFGHLNHLEKLIINGNQISDISDGAFNNTPALKHLELNNNKISWTIEDMMGPFMGLGHLVKFSLASNNIKSINKNAFVGLESLTRLDLGDNNITTVQENAFVSTPRLQDLVMNTSSLICDCNLQWFSNWLQEMKFPSSEARCAYPLHLRNKNLIELSRNNFTCGDSPKPLLIEEPETKMTLKGDNVTLRCRANSSSPSPMEFLWKHDNVEIKGLSQTKQLKLADGRKNEAISELTLYSVTHSDAGDYQCIVENRFGSTYSHKASISVLIYPSFTKKPQNILVAAGETAKLECEAKGQPPPTIAWQKDGGNDFPAARERRMHVFPSDDAFFIINAKYNDMGVYSCTANNTAGIIVANASLTVLERPSFSTPMENKEVTVGGTIVLQCMAGGTPRPTVSWGKDGGSLSRTERHFFTAEDQLLVIVNAKISDAGTYECKLSNKLGVERGYTQLSVLPTNTINEGDMMGIMIITVVCCAVGTSIIWVVIIYHTRKRISMSALATQDYPAGRNTLNSDQTVGVPATAVCVYTDTTSEHSSCKDSGMGDSAKRSSDDLLPVEDYSLIDNGLISGEVNEETKAPNNSETAASPMLVIEIRMPEDEDSVLPQSLSRPTNHERLSLVPKADEETLID